MSVALRVETVPAHPLGIPVDGRDRYGMTPEQAITYRHLVKTKPHDEAFTIHFRTLSRSLICGLSNVHQRVTGLVERGWLTVDRKGRYTFVHPVMQFRSRNV
jgi:diaminopimelate decarboxylase